MHLLARVLNLKSMVSQQMLQASQVLACFPILALNIFQKDLEQQHILVHPRHFEEETQMFKLKLTHKTLCYIGLHTHGPEAIPV